MTKIILDTNVLVADLYSSSGVSAVSEKISAIMTEDYLSQRAKKADRNKFKEMLNNVPNRKPLAGDEL